MTFERRHYEYLAYTILNDPNTTQFIRAQMYTKLSVWFNRDFPNFDEAKWSKKWVDHFHSDLNSPVQPNVSESKELPSITQETGKT